MRNQNAINNWDYEPAVKPHEQRLNKGQFIIEARTKREKVRESVNIKKTIEARSKRGQFVFYNTIIC